ncbi:lytic polysaccharide monooxygenase [Listeria goaensis]|uniref:lytic polysaccharide monooxygenase n=1 Tax=Listeria goaensis TaxID=1649188 RepID=UPI000B591CE4|nr:lytic polysaccharide monooxygenase [Listeria goaensis]
MKNKLKLGVFLGVVSVCLTAGFTLNADAHGYISKPESRAYLANKGLNVNVGAVQYEPQSVEGPKGFPSRGPVDGTIAGAGKYAPLDEQTASRWHKVNLNPGPTVVEWTLTAPHPTSSWDYYITKKGWNPNMPLVRSELELIKHIDGGNLKPEKVVRQQIDIPSDRSGYYVILGVWSIADTGNAFYQVIDANISGDAKPSSDSEAPTQPTQLKRTMATANSIAFSWKASTDNVGVAKYTVYRNGVKVGETAGTSYTDKNLQSEKAYTYTVVAEDFSGNKSTVSQPLTLSTTQVPAVDTVAPTAPANLHVMGQKESSVSLMWNAASDNVRVSQYEVYRNGKKVKTTASTMFEDVNLVKGNYDYTVYAVDAAGNRSKASNGISVNVIGGGEIIPPVPVVGDDVWQANKIYFENDVVNYNGKTYRAKWWTRANNPEYNSVWQLVSDHVQVWNAQKAYTAGERVSYNGKIYQAKWWVRGQSPDLGGAWE